MAHDIIDNRDLKLIDELAASAVLGTLDPQLSLRALAERRGGLGAWAADGLGLSEIVFRLWHAFGGGTIEREHLQAAMEPIQATMLALLERDAALGRRLRDQPRTAGAVGGALDVCATGRRRADQ